MWRRSAGLIGSPCSARSLGEKLAQTAILTCSLILSQAPPFLIMSAYSRILKNSWASASMSSRGAPSSLGMTTFARRPWICDQGSR